MKKKYILFIICFIHLSASEIVFLNGARIKDLIIEQCNFGPRFPGSTGHNSAKRFFIEFLENNSDTVYIYNHETISPLSKKKVTLTNMLARYNPDIESRFILLAHWDTREIAEKEKNKSLRSLPIIGANDGASGVAILLTLSELLKSRPLKTIGLDILLVDGEDMGVSGSVDSWGIGTQYFAKQIPNPKPKFGICLDMVGDYNPEFLIEQYSYRFAPKIVHEIWSLANSIGYNEFKFDFGKAIIDDHYMLFKHGGIPTINIIDFDYPDKSTNFWHTHDDIPENCSSRTLGIVGTVIATYIYKKDNE